MSVVAVLGAGPIGAALAHRLAQRGRLSEVRLIDPAETVARGTALDIQQSGPVEHFTTHINASSDTLVAATADVIIVADTTVAGGGRTADESVALVARLMRAGATAPFVFADPAHGAVMERCVRDLHVPPDRLVGTAASAVVGTVRALAAVEMGVSSVELTVVGRPPFFVVGWAAASAGGVLVTDRLPAHRLLDISQSLPRFWPPGPYAIASATAPVVEALIAGSRRLHPAVTMLEEAHGVSGVAAMLPLSLGQGRVLSSSRPSLSPLERNTFLNSLT